MTQATSLGSVLLAISTVAALVLAFALPLDARLWLYLHSAVPWSALLLLGTCASTALLVTRAIRAGNASEHRTIAIDLLISVAAMTLIVAQLPARALIETDESQYMASADSIRFTGRIPVPSSGIYSDDGELHATTVDIHKRGEVYPLLLAATRVLGGNQSLPATTVNLFAGGILLFAFARLLRAFGAGSLLVATGVLLFVAFPVVAITIRSGMYDVFNAALLVMLVLVTRSQLMVPHPHKIVALAFLALTLAQIRPEMLLVTAAAIGLILLREFRAHGLRVHPALAFLPLAVVPGCWRFAIPINLELPAQVQAAWGFDHFANNLSALLKWLLWPSVSGNQVVAIAGIVAVLWMILIWRPRWRLSQLGPALLLVVTLPALLYSYWGQTGNVLTVRYFIPLAAGLTLAAIIGLSQLARPGYRARWLPPVVATAALALLVHSNAVAARSWEIPYTSVHRDDVLAELDARYGRCNVLLVTHFPIMFITRDRGAIFPGDWDRLGARVASWAPGLGVHAIVAISPKVTGRDGIVGSLDFSDLPIGTEWSRSNPQVTTAFREIWHAPATLPDCRSMKARRGINPMGLRTALPLWKLAPASNGEPASSTP